MPDEPPFLDTLEIPNPLFPARRKPIRRSGWLFGVIFGVVFGLWALPPVRYTLGAQLAFAFAEDSIPWMRALDTRHNTREIPRLEAVAAAAPTDYLMQVGRATARADSSLRETDLPGTDENFDDKTLLRLGIVARDFPTIPGAYAHFARYMMAARIRVQRTEIDSHLMLDAAQPDTFSPEKAIRTGQTFGLLPLPGHSLRAHRRDVQLMEWALRSGEHCDPDNAFWPTMLATTYFSAQRDQDALNALQRASRKSHWDAYIHEEVLGQWRLYSAAYGDNGAAQKIAPLSTIAFPHLMEIRRMAEMARWYAEHEANRGHYEKAVHIRRSLTWLGVRMRETAQWSLEALCGNDLLLTSATDSGASLAPAAISSVRQWEQQSPRYRTFLQKAGFAHDISWLYAEVQNSCDLRARVDVARYDASYPGIPPGIPLMPLFGDWIIGTCLIQQMLSLSLAALIVVVLQRIRRGRRPLPHFVRVLLWLVLLGATGVCGVQLLGVPSTRDAIGFVAGTTILLLSVFEQFSRFLAGKRGGNVVEAREEPETLAEMRWRPATSWRMLALLLAPGLLALYLLRPQLSFLHPVATLLMSIMGGSHLPLAHDAIELAFLTCGLPVAFVLTASLWAIRRHVSPVAGVSVGLRRIWLPALTCLSIFYLLLLDRTLRMDAAASRGISAVAQNDLQWVLTHSPVPASEEDTHEAN